MPKGIKYGGRVKGTPNKATEERRLALDNFLLDHGIDPFPGDGVDFLKFVYQNQVLPMSVRIDAAKAAAPYERARPMPELGVIEPVRVVLQDLRKPALASKPNTIQEAVLVTDEAAD